MSEPSDNEEYAQNQKIAAIPLVLRNCGGGSGCGGGGGGGGVGGLGCLEAPKIG